MGDAMITGDQAENNGRVTGVALADGTETQLQAKREYTQLLRLHEQLLHEGTEVGTDADHPVPAGLRAELRPYQRDGFGWLAALHAHRG